jgi:hypothetical protein
MKQTIPHSHTVVTESWTWADIDATAAYAHGSDAAAGSRDLGSLARRRGVRVGLAARGEVEQIAFDVGQLQGAGDRVQDVIGDAADVALLQADVPVRAVPGEHGDLFGAQPRYGSVL